jgi:hypothetical protein
MVAPAPLRTRIRISEGYDPDAVRYTRIVAPTAAENVEEVGPYPEQLKLDKTVTPLTETATVPPFQPSPHVSVRCMVCIHDCEKKYDVINKNTDSRNDFIVVLLFFATRLKNPFKKPPSSMGRLRCYLVYIKKRPKDLKRP